ncbi:MAG: hypothetical protein JRJ85_09935, partial [Deltaproteobacteria bacterium]|nr:hypothetical protein [Deltaproteobacteria bacterium]
MAGCIFALTVMIIPVDANALEMRWTGTTGDWIDPSNWDIGRPGVTDLAIINNGGTAEINAGSEACAILRIGFTNTNSGNLVMSGGGLYVKDISHTGYGGTGTFDHSGGTHTVDGGLHVGTYSNGHGTYDLDGSGSLMAHSMYIGNAGIGIFNHSAGTA